MRITIVMHGENTERSFIFILDKDALSVAEILSYLEVRGVRYNVVGRSNQSLILSSSTIRPRAIASDLGGTFKIGLVKSYCSWGKGVDMTDLLRLLDEYTFHGNIHDKTTWAVSVYGGARKEREFLMTTLVDHFSSRLREEGIHKAKCLSRTLIHDGESTSEILSEDIVRRRVLEDGFEVLVAVVEGRLYFASTLAVVDHIGFRRRDLHRPFLDSSITIPPRLARIMLNLAGVSKRMVVLDPFCGLGTILMEALVLGADVLGVDLDSRRVKQTVGNLHWLSKTEHIEVPDLERRIIQGDARRLSTLIAQGQRIDAVVTEPILLPKLSARPNSTEARRLISASERIYGEALMAIRDLLKCGGRVVFTTPIIETKEGGSAVLSASHAIRSAGFEHFEFRNRSLNPPYPTGESEQIVHRNVQLLVKR